MEVKPTIIILVPFEPRTLKANEYKSFAINVRLHRLCIQIDRAFST